MSRAQKILEYVGRINIGGLPSNALYIKGFSVIAPIVVISDFNTKS